MNPPPVNKGIIVPEKLIEWINQQSVLSDDIKTTTINLIQSRNDFGVEKYGQPLMTQDGRRTMQDAMEELGDLMQYIFKAKLNNEDTTEIKQLLPVLFLLLT